MTATLPPASGEPTNRPAPPELYFPYPDCSVCGNECEYDGVFFCDACGISWPQSGEADGEWADPKAEQCPSTHQPHARNPYFEGKGRYDVRRCVLSAGHEDKVAHRCDQFTSWTDANAMNGMGPEAVKA